MPPPLLPPLLADKLTAVVKRYPDLAPQVPALTPPALNSVGDKLTHSALVEAIRSEEPFDLIVFGNESADAGNYQVPIRVAHQLGLPCVTGVKAIAVQSDGSLRCEQEVADGRDVYLVPTPAVVSVKEGINLPRYPSVPGRLRAKRKPLEASEPAREPAQLEMVRLTLPPSAGKQGRSSSARASSTSSWCRRPRGSCSTPRTHTSTTLARCSFRT